MSISISISNIPDSIVPVGGPSEAVVICIPCKASPRPDVTKNKWDFQTKSSQDLANVILNVNSDYIAMGRSSPKMLVGFFEESDSPD